MDQFTKKTCENLFGGEVITIFMDLASIPARNLGHTLLLLLSIARKYFVNKKTVSNNGVEPKCVVVENSLS